MEACLLLAVKHHATQQRKCWGIPYVVHPIRVAELTRKYASELKADDATQKRYGAPPFFTTRRKTPRFLTLRFSCPVDEKSWYW